MGLVGTRELNRAGHFETSSLSTLVVTKLKGFRSGVRRTTFKFL